MNIDKKKKRAAVYYRVGNEFLKAVKSYKNLGQMKIITGKSNLAALYVDDNESTNLKSIIYSLLANSFAGVVMVDSEEKISVCNKKMLSLLGKRDLPRDILGTSADVFFAEFPDFLRVLNRNSDLIHLPIGDLSFKVRILKTPYGKMLMVYETSSLLKARIDLQEQREMVEKKDEFLNIAAHDLRGPAGAIRGFISRVLDGDAGEINPKAKELITDAYEGSRRLVNLVNDILTMTRFGRGMIEIVPKKGDLAAWVKVVIKEEGMFATERNITLEYKTKKIPAVFADEDRVIEVLTNLVGNAIKFTEKGGITISHELKKGVVITHVRDTGRGISKEQQENLFKKFADRGHAKGSSGLGLGLYISKLIIDQLNGKIWVKSTEYKGTTFSFSLPVAK